MRKLAITSILAAAALNAAQAAEILVERTLDSPVEKVWGVLGTFCSIRNWQSLVDTCDVYENRHGIHRTVVMRNGDVFVERLGEFSDSRHSFTYTILAGPLGLRNYEASLDFDATRNGRTRLIWRARFDFEPGREQEMADTLTGLFENGIDGMESMLDSSRDR